RRIVGRRREHLVPRSKTAHDLKPKFRQSLWRKSFASWLVQNPCSLPHLSFELARCPAGVSNKRSNGAGVLGHPQVGLLYVNVVVQLQTRPLFPFKGRKHQLIFPHRTTKKHWYSGQPTWRRLTHQIGHLLIKGAIDDNTTRAINRLVLIDE